ncbi:MAG: succinylglutamate desuccinylase/aspartoacylase family protein [Sphingomonadales bacterium]|nr:succinylglutamate desuccinylase/aspartoacylase family protein [Sphingomonadales bacterium]
MAIATKPEAPGEPFAFSGEQIAPGTVAMFDLPISRVSSGQIACLPVHVIHGRKPGPVLFVSAAIHGDEIIGVEIVRRLLKRIAPRSLAGTLLCVPIVNVFGFVANSRYLPDRRDLNRSFPGSPTGSLASQLAYIFHNEIVRRADFGIDLHSAAVHRKNLPQIRISEGSERAAEMALAFGAPAIIASQLRDNSLRKVARDTGVEMLLYEAGEGLRFDDYAIRTGVRGIMRVMNAMGMLQSKRLALPLPTPARSTRTGWLRAPQGGICLMERLSGDVVNEGQIVALVTDISGAEQAYLRAPCDGIIIGHATLPVVNRGDALIHIAEVRRYHNVEERMGEISDIILSDVELDEDEML